MFIHIGIDASNISSGGGLTHLVELLNATEPAKHGISRISLWAPKKTLAKIGDSPWIVKKYSRAVESGPFVRMLWQTFVLGEKLRAENCDVLLVPGGSFFTRFKPVVCISQNMLPFDEREISRYKRSKTFIKLAILRMVLSKSFKKAEGVIFLSSYAQKAISTQLGMNLTNTARVPHGLNRSFFKNGNDTPKRPGDEMFILYVSHIEPYKHHVNVLKACEKLRKTTFEISLNFIGAEGNSAKTFSKAMSKFRHPSITIHYSGKIPYEELKKYYHKADIFIYASSCENMPITLLEAMAAGLPIACSNFGPMPEMLKSAGLYFNPEIPDEITNAVQLLVESKSARMEYGARACSLAKAYSWEACASKTYEFVKSVTQRHIGGIT